MPCNAGYVASTMFAVGRVQSSSDGRDSDDALSLTLRILPLTPEVALSRLRNGTSVALQSASTVGSVSGGSAADWSWELKPERRYWSESAGVLE